MYITWLDNNSWLIEMGGQKILIDPWLVGSLSFNLDWLFKGSLKQERLITEKIDLILLSQGLADHSHIPTLKQLDPHIPVVASPNAAKIVQELGYISVTSLAHGESFKLNNQIEIKAFPGSPIGPTLVENSYFLKELDTGITLYYEPHGYHSPQLKQVAPVDVIITPTVDLALPLVGAIIRGTNSTLEVAKWLQPQFILPTAATAETSYEGLLSQLLKDIGSAEELRAALRENNLITQVMEPKPGDRFQLPLQKRVLTH
ncbi:MBL fold metallo-hydrolase [Nostoc sp. FACHB-152]|uniref:MBL fold metallo-hydrolase n=1 Tax=unclassified Nostoc TaxID=2593658 RepID=UPI001688137F|nr:MULTISPECIES: MBL fold metallo-hydrolase [unclassified Nostoc]MBD2447107.1 MBL fold metallo-hydrolase [Nostoc sp. FACHB-152]MBD2469214.1 MBL fold metallo-hydrolase [Nostoc sp. FACHB-145]